MTNNFLPNWISTTPNFIVGKWDALNDNPVFKQAYGDTFITNLRDMRINKYELWFTSTIEFIPYNSPFVFLVDTSGNLTHTGNLLTKKDATVEKNLTVKESATVEKNVTIKTDALIEGKLNVIGEIRTSSNVVAANLAPVFAAIGEIDQIKTATADIQRAIDDIRRQIQDLKSSGGGGSGGGAGGGGAGSGAGAGVMTGFDAGSGGSNFGNRNNRSPSYLAQLNGPWPRRLYIGPRSSSTNRSMYWTDDELITWAEHYNVPTDSVLIELRVNALGGEVPPLRSKVAYVWVDPSATDLIDVLLGKVPNANFNTIGNIFGNIVSTASNTRVMRIPGVRLIAPPRRDTGAYSPVTDGIERPRIRQLNYRRQVSIPFYTLHYENTSFGVDVNYTGEVQPNGVDTQDLFYPFWTSLTGKMLAGTYSGNTNVNFTNMDPSLRDPSGNSSFLTDEGSGGLFGINDRYFGILEVFDKSFDLTSLPPATKVIEYKSPGVPGPGDPALEFELNSPALFRMPVIDRFSVPFLAGYKYRLVIPSWAGNVVGFNAFGYHTSQDFGKTVIGPTYDFRLSPGVLGSIYRRNGSDGRTLGEWNTEIRMYSRIGSRPIQFSTNFRVGTPAVYSDRDRGFSTNVGLENQAIEIFMEPGEYDINGFTIDTVLSNSARSRTTTLSTAGGDVVQNFVLEGNRLADIPFTPEFDPAIFN